MPGEFPSEKARKFVEQIATLFHENNGFTVNETAYEGSEAATVKIGSEIVRFDILMSRHESTPLSAKHFYCEAKWRTDVSDLKAQFKLFLADSRKVMQEAKRRYGQNFGFIFFANLHFGISNSVVKNLDQLGALLSDTTASSTELKELSEKLTILTLDDWLLDNLTGEL